MLYFSPLIFDNTTFSMLMSGQHTTFVGNNAVLLLPGWRFGTFLFFHWEFIFHLTKTFFSEGRLNHQAVTNHSMIIITT